VTSNPDFKVTILIDVKQLNVVQDRAIVVVIVVVVVVVVVVVYL